MKEEAMAEWLKATNDLLAGIVKVLISHDKQMADDILPVITKYYDTVVNIEGIEEAK